MSGRPLTYLFTQGWRKKLLGDLRSGRKTNPTDSIRTLARIAQSEEDALEASEDFWQGQEDIDALCDRCRGRDTLKVIS
jgi:hypothetical protein